MPLVEEALSYEILNAAYAVHNRLGPGFTEIVYKKAMIIELRSRGRKVEVEKRILVSYRDEIIAEFFLDLVVDEKVILELKAVSEILVSTPNRWGGSSTAAQTQRLSQHFGALTNSSNPQTTGSRLCAGKRFAIGNGSQLWR